MKEYFKSVWRKNPRVRKVIGILLLILGFISIITPLTPFGFLFFVGLEVLGIRLLFWNKVKGWLRKALWPR